MIFLTISKDVLLMPTYCTRDELLTGYIFTICNDTVSPFIKFPDWLKLIM